MTAGRCRDQLKLGELSGQFCHLKWKGVLSLKDRDQKKSSGTNIRNIHLSIPEDTLMRIDSEREVVHMNRSEYICQLLEKGSVIQLSIPEEDRELLRDCFGELDGIRITLYQTHLFLLLTGQLMPHMETDYHEMTNDLSAIRKELEEWKGRSNT